MTCLIIAVKIKPATDPLSRK